MEHRTCPSVHSQEVLGGGSHLLVLMPGTEHSVYLARRCIRGSNSSHVALGCLSSAVEGREGVAGVSAHGSDNFGAREPHGTYLTMPEASSVLPSAPSDLIAARRATRVLSDQDQGRDRTTTAMGESREQGAGADYRSASSRTSTSTSTSSNNRINNNSDNSSSISAFEGEVEVAAAGLVGEGLTGSTRQGTVHSTVPLGDQQARVPLTSSVAFVGRQISRVCTCLSRLCLSKGMSARDGWVAAMQLAGMSHAFFC